MSTATKTLAKSLHTVSVLVAVARIYLSRGDCDVALAMSRAQTQLGYFGASDPHGLVAKATAVLAREVQS